MKKQSTNGFGTKLFLIVLFICGFFMFCNLLMAFEETEEIEGTVEHTYISRSYNSITKRSSNGVPMCRVVWYDKDGEKVIYGMPNDLGYEVGDSYYVEVDMDTNRIPERFVGEALLPVLLV